jgi:NAD(P)H-dependent FMN reductase
MTYPRTVLGLCGSLRAASINHAVLLAAVSVAPPGTRVELYPSLAGLPLFNPDLDAIALSPVARLRERIVAADAVLIASPEYAHGVSGVIKNALDWLVGDMDFNSHMKNTAYLDKTADVHQMLLIEQGFSSS